MRDIDKEIESKRMDLITLENDFNNSFEKDPRGMIPYRDEIEADIVALKKFKSDYPIDDYPEKYLWKDIQ